RQADTAPVENGTASSGRRAARTPLFAAAVMALAALGVAAAWWLMSPFPPPAPHTKDHIALASEAPSSAERLRAPAPSIVVLPFVNLSGDAQQGYLADGITDSLISDVARAARNLHRLPRHRVHLQGPGRGRAADRPRAGGALPARGQRRPRGRPRARQHP